jgi:hypothetical protein
MSFWAVLSWVKTCVNSLLGLLLVDVRLTTVEQSEAVAMARLAMALADSCWNWMAAFVEW